MAWMLPAAVGGSAILGGGSSLVGSGKASSGAKAAANTNLAMYNATANRLQPWVTAGANALPGLNALLPGTETQAQLEQTPGYQFTLNQGEKGVQAANAARGLGVSGAALKGAASYATGLASNTYQNIFNQQQTKYSDVFNQAQMGANAAAGVGQAGTAAGAQAGNALIQQGIDQAAGASGVGSAATGAVNNYLQYSLLQKYMQNGGSTGGYDVGGLPKSATADTGWQPA